MPKQRSETARAGVRETILAHARTIQKKGVTDREIADLEETYKRFDGDPLDLPWNNGSTPPPPPEPKGDGLSRNYERCPGGEQQPKDTAGEEVQCVVCERWFKAKVNGLPRSHKAKEK